MTCGNGVSRRSYQCVDGRRSIDRGSCDQSLLQNTKSCSSPRTCVDWSSSSSEGFPSLIQRGLAEQEPIQTTITGQHWTVNCGMRKWTNSNKRVSKGHFVIQDLGKCLSSNNSVDDVVPVDLKVEK